MYHKVRQHLLTHKERVQKKLLHIRSRIQFQHQKTKEHINNMVSHRFFYPILISSFAVIGILALWTYASNDRETLRMSEDLLPNICVYENNKITKCEKYGEFQTKIDDILQKFLPKIKTKYWDAYWKQIWKTVLAIEYFDISKLDEKKLFALQYLNYKLRNELYKARNPEKLVITSQIWYWYGYWYKDHKVSKWKKENLQEFNFVNKNNTKITISNLIIENTKDEDFVNIQDIEDIELKIKFWNELIDKKCEWKVNKTTQKIVFPCSFYLSPNWNYTIYIQWEIKEENTKNKLKLQISNQTIFISNQEKIQKEDILIIKDYNYSTIE